jgi:ABC-type transporter Mla MlaB component
VNVQSVTALNAALGRPAPPWQVDWRHLKAIELAALAALSDTFWRWANAPVRLKFLGAERLLEVLAENSPADDRQADPAWWHARLALLRVLGEMEEFDLVALNYCVTYEVSPPAWEDPQNSYSPMTEEGHTIMSSEPDSRVPLEQPSRGFGMTATMDDTTLVPDDSLVRVELKGELLGSAESAVQRAHPASTTGLIEFNCRHLLRVDFGAAGDLLNWSIAQKKEGRQVSFKQVNRLVAAFFGVIGITDTARVVLRSD